jgi:hypothetical protein
MPHMGNKAKYLLSKPCTIETKNRRCGGATAFIYLKVTDALWFRSSQQNKIAWYFFILSNPNYVTNTDILSLNLYSKKWRGSYSQVQCSHNREKKSNY